MRTLLASRCAAVAFVVALQTNSGAAQPTDDAVSLDRICREYAEPEKRRLTWSIFEALNEDARGTPISAAFGDALRVLRAGRHREGVLLLAAASFTSSDEPLQRHAASGARLLLARIMACDPTGRLPAPERSPLWVTQSANRE